MADDLKGLNQNVKDLISGMKQNFDRAASTIGGEVRGVMSEEMNMVVDHMKNGFEILKDTGTRFGKFLQQSLDIDFGGFEEDKKILKQEKKQTGILEEMLNMQKFMFRKRLAGMASGGKGFLKALFDLLGIPLLIIGAAIGAFVGQMLLPFRVLGKPLMWLLKFGRFLFGAMLHINKFQLGVLHLG
jgi:hypothetical protein